MKTIEQCCEILEKAYNDITFKRGLLDGLDAANYYHVQMVNQHFNPTEYVRNVDISLVGEEFEPTLLNGFPHVIPTS